MRRTALVVSVMSLLGFAPDLAPAAQAATPTYGSEILRWTNVARSHHHLAPLAPASCASPYAVRWSRHLAAIRELAHQSLGPIMTTCHADAAAENVGCGNITPQQMVTLWLNSPSHRRNLLSSGYTALAVYAVRSSVDRRVYATQDFVRG